MTNQTAPNTSQSLWSEIQRASAKRLELAMAKREYEQALMRLEARQQSYKNMLETNRVVRKVCSKYPAEMTDVQFNEAAAEVARLCKADLTFGEIMCMSVYGVRGHGANTLRKARQDIKLAEKKVLALAQCVIALL